MTNSQIATVKNFLKTISGNQNFNEAQYKAYDKFTNGIWYAWENWGDDTTKEFWGGEEKPAKPTAEFVADYISNMDSDELEPIAEAFNL